MEEYKMKEGDFVERIRDQLRMTYPNMRFREICDMCGNPSKSVRKHINIYFPTQHFCSKLCHDKWVFMNQHEGWEC